MSWVAGDRPERDKMLGGDLYYPYEADLTAARARARRLVRLFNATDETELPRRAELLRSLCGAVGKNCYIEPPFRCDYGEYIRLGDNVFMNFDCVILDCAEVTIGDNVLMAPGVHIYAATHPVDVGTRTSLLECAKPVRIGANSWIGGRAVICPGVTIGSDVVIGAGSVVTRDIPDGTIAVGNPCRVIRTLTAEERRVRPPVVWPAAGTPE